MSFRNEIFKFFNGLSITIAIWWIAALYIDKNFLPDPLTAFRYFFSENFSDEAFQNFYISFKRIGISLFLAVIIGFPLGIITGVNKWVDRFISPLLYFLYPLPKIVFLPVFFIFWGIHEKTRIFLIFFILVFQIIVNVRDGIKNISLDYLELYKTMGAKKIDFFKLYIFFALPSAFTALRISIGMSVAVLFITENFVADKGLGFIILNAMELRNYPEMYCGIVLMGFLGYFFYLTTDFLERKVCFWNQSMIE